MFSKISQTNKGPSGLAAWRQAGVAITFSLFSTLGWAVDLPGPLVEPAWLKANLAEVHVLDIRGNAASFSRAPKFEQDKKTGNQQLAEIGGHVPGAVYVDPRKTRTTRTIAGNKISYMLPEQADFEKLARDWGVSKDKPLVIVSPGMSATDVNDATRLYWQFKVYGQDKIAVLNGGLAGWIADKQPVDTEPRKVAAGDWVASAERAEYLATSDDVAHAVANGSSQLVDSRDSSMYLGLTKRNYVYAFGHIPGAKLIPSEVMVESEGASARMFSPVTYRDMFTLSGIDPDKPAITYCNSGHLASTSWFVLSELLGNKRARLYDGSTHQWTTEKRPMVSVKRS